MVRTIDLINHVKANADAGVGADADGCYGTQCVDEVNDLSITFFGKSLWGNAIDLLNSARDAGFEVVENVVGDVSSAPRASAAFVQDTTYIAGHPYGHTGLVIEDSDGYTMRTIEQNIDGNADSLYVGGPARYNTRNFDGIVGWFYFRHLSLSQLILTDSTQRQVHSQSKFQRLMYGHLLDLLVKLWQSILLEWKSITTAG